MINNDDWMNKFCELPSELIELETTTGDEGSVVGFNINGWNDNMGVFVLVVSLIGFILDSVIGCWLDDGDDEVGRLVDNGSWDGIWLEIRLGELDWDTLGYILGICDGSDVGISLGWKEGSIVGRYDGDKVGDKFGTVVGSSDGVEDGDILGSKVGLNDG